MSLRLYLKGTCFRLPMKSSISSAILKRASRTKCETDKRMISTKKTKLSGTTSTKIVEDAKDWLNKGDRRRRINVYHYFVHALQHTGSTYHPLCGSDNTNAKIHYSRTGTENTARYYSCFEVMF